MMADVNGGAQQFVFFVGLQPDGQLRWTLPQGVDDVYVRGILDKIKEIIVAEMKRMASPISLPPGSRI